MGRAYGTCGKLHRYITGFLRQDLMERGNLEDLDIEMRIILKLKFKKLDREAWTGLIWLRLGTGGRFS